MIKTVLIRNYHMEENKYLHFKAVDFSKDQRFLKWRFERDESSSIFWEEYKEKHPEQVQEIKRAIEIIDSVVIIDPIISTKEKEIALTKLNRRYLQRDKKKNRLILYTTSAVAGLALLLTLGWFIGNQNITFLKAKSDTIKIGDENNEDQIRLISAGQTLIIENNTDIICNEQGVLNVKEDKQITSREHVQTNIYDNKLIVPYGKRSSLLLSDGSKIWINSGSELEFPSVFNSNKREIKVKGEIYIEVAKKDKQDFYVHTDQVSVKVLGTIFNVSSYKEDACASVVLVKGSVEATTPTGITRRLRPEQMMTVSGNDVAIQKVNVSYFTSWKDGQLYFNGELLGNILRKLARYYAVEMIFDEKIGEQRCSGKLVLMDDIEEVLKNISIISPVTYRKNNNQIKIEMRKN